MANGYIIHKELIEGRQQNDLTQMKFREVLCEPAKDGDDSEASQEEDRRHCYPVTVVDTSTLAKKDKASVERRHCVLCLQKKYSKTIYKCSHCNVALHITTSRLRFTRWHELTDLSS